MKKGALILLAIAAMVWSSCNNAGQQSTAKDSTAAKAQPQAKQAAAPKQQRALAATAAGNFQVPSLYKDVIKTADAKDLIDRYQSTPKNKSALSFVFSIDELVDYIDKGQVDLIHLLLGEGADKTLYLIIASVNDQGTHNYFYTAQGGDCYTLCSSKHPYDEKLEPETPVIKDAFIEAIRNQDANNAISAYRSYMGGILPAKLRPFTFLYNTKNLYTYITQARDAGATDVQFSLAKFGNNVDFIVVPVSQNDTATVHYYFSSYNVPCSMENCHPCPCIIYDNGRSLEMPASCN